MGLNDLAEEEPEFETGEEFDLGLENPEPTPEVAEEQPTEETDDFENRRSGGRRASNLNRERNREVASKEIPQGNKLAENKLTETEKDVFDIIDEWHKSYPSHKMEYIEWLKINYPKEFEALKNSIKSYDNEVEENKLTEAIEKDGPTYKRLCDEIEFQAEEEGIDITEEQIKQVADKICYEDRYFFNNSLPEDEEDWSDVNTYILNTIKEVLNLEESKLTEDEDLSYIDSDTNNCKVYYAVNTSGYKSLGLIVNDKDKKFQVVAGQKLRTGSKTAKKSKKQIWDMAKELKNNGYEEVRGPSSVAGEVNESEEIKEEAKEALTSMLISNASKTESVSEKVKGMEDWKTDLMSDFKKGDLVSDEIVQELRNSYPPITDTNKVVQGGEEYSYNQNGPTYITFTKVGNNWRFEGALNKMNDTSNLEETIEKLVEDSDKEYIIEEADDDKITELEKGSAFTFEGIDISEDSLDSMMDYFKKNLGEDNLNLPLTLYHWLGSKMNEKY